MVREVPDYPAKFVTDGKTFVTPWQAKGDAIAFNRRANIGLHHLALSVDSRQQLTQLFARISAYPGVDIDFPPRLMGDGPATHCIFFEPGGIRLELVWTGA